MRQGELVGVVDVRDAEVKRCVKQGLPGAQGGEEVLGV